MAADVRDTLGVDGDAKLALQFAGHLTFDRVLLVRRDGRSDGGRDGRSGAGRSNGSSGGRRRWGWGLAERGQEERERAEVG
jgi:hypothetical protein